MVTIKGFEASRSAALRDARVIVICADKIGSRDLTWIREVVQTFPLAQVILLMRVRASNVRILADLPEILAGVVDVGEAATVLRERVGSLVAEHYLDRAAEWMTERRAVSGVARAFLNHAWCMSAPPTSVGQVLREIRVPPSTLRDHWAFDAPPKEFLDWALLGRATAIRRRGASWPRAGASVGTSRRRLERIALRRLDRSLDAIDGEDEEWLERQFRDWLEGAALGVDSDKALEGQ